MQIGQYIHQILLEGIEDIASQQEMQGFNPRKFIPKVRGGWTKDKILRYLKSAPSYNGSYQAARFISEFNNIDDLKDHIFWHGSPYHQTQLKPSITRSERWAETYGGGGYGQRYWGISLTSDKYIATHFAGQERGVIVHPVVLAKNAVVKDLPDFSDAIDVDDIIVQLYTDGVDAVYIGKRGEGEKELLVINPKSICNMDAAQYYECYQLFKDKVPMPTDQQYEELLQASKDYVSEYRNAPRKPMKPLKPTEPGRYIFDKDNPFMRKDDETYDREMEDYRNNQLRDYDAKMSEYEKALTDYENSQERKDWENRRYELRRRFRI